MAKFYVGQRVRVVRSNSSETDSFVGMEAVVTEIEVEGWRDGSTMYGLDIHPIIQVQEDDEEGWGTYVGFDDTELEPLTPTHEACDDAEFIASIDRLAAKVGEMA